MLYTFKFFKNIIYIYYITILINITRNGRFIVHLTHISNNDCHTIVIKNSDFEF